MPGLAFSKWLFPPLHPFTYEFHFSLQLNTIYIVCIYYISIMHWHSWWTSRLFLSPCYCEQSSNNHGRARIPVADTVRLCPGGGILGYTLELFLAFGGTVTLIFIGTVQVCGPSRSKRPLPTSPAALSSFAFLFLATLISSGKMKSQSSFHLYFPDG